MSKGRLVSTLSVNFMVLLLGSCCPFNFQDSTLEPVPSSTPWMFEEVTYAPGAPYNGLDIMDGGDVDFEMVSVPDIDEAAVRSGNGEVITSNDGNDVADYYLQFQVDDGFLYAGSPTTRAAFSIDYLDDGLDTFNIQYDALSGGPHGNGKFKDTVPVYKTGTGEIKTVEIQVCDANFANRDADADFRIADGADGAETIFRVGVQIIPDLASPVEISVDSCGANPFDDQPDSEAIQSCINLACSGDTVVFTSGVNEPDYQGYMIDRTILLVYPQAKSDLTFRSTYPNHHALLKATADLHGFVVHLYPRSITQDIGLIDNITIQHLDLDGNRAERSCTGDPLPGQENALPEGENDNWGSWLPAECNILGDSWCSPGTLYLSGEVDYTDPAQDYAAHPDRWSTGMVVQDVTLSNTECGTAFFFSGADFLIDSVTVDTAGEHVHAPGCAMTETDDPVGAWSDGITFMGPAHRLTNNLIMDASDVGMVSFGGRDILISDNTIRARPGNHGAFAGIAMHPGTLGLISGLKVTNNHVINEADPTCGGIHIGINLGVHTWGNGCNGAPVAASYGIPDDCSIFSPPPEGRLCDTGTICRTWGHIPAGETLTLADNVVEGAQASYVISGLDVLGELILSDNESIHPHLTDWEEDVHCVWTEGYVDSWGALNFVAFDPAVDGWVEQRIFCVR
jgi:hypothetical protein